jgi:hypothetical protein
MEENKKIKIETGKEWNGQVRKFWKDNGFYFDKELPLQLHHLIVGMVLEAKKVENEKI